MDEEDDGLTPSQRTEVKELIARLTGRGPTSNRRDVLKAGGLMSVGALIGSGGTIAMSESEPPQNDKDNSDRAGLPLIGDQESITQTLSDPHLGATRALQEIGELQYTPDVRGTRMNAWLNPITQDSEFLMRETNWTTVRQFGWVSMEVPPNKVPVLRAYLHISNDTAGETTKVRIGIDQNGVSDAPLQFSTTGRSDSYLYDEVYLTELNNGTAVRNALFSRANYRVWAKVSGGAGTLYGDSALLLDWEVV